MMGQSGEKSQGPSPRLVPLDQGQPAWSHTAWQMALDRSSEQTRYTNQGPRGERRLSNGSLENAE